MDEIQNENQPLNLPVVALRDIVIYPRMSVNLDIGRKESVEAVRFAGKGERYLVMAMQKDSRVEVPQEDDLYDVCTVVKVTQMLQMPGGLIRVLVEGVSRVKLLKVTRGDRFLSADVDDIEEIKPEDELRAEAFRRTLLKSFFEWLHNTKQGLPEDQMEQLKSITDPGETADFIASQLLLKPQQRQRVLEEADVASRLKLVQGYLDMEIEIVHLESEISSDVRQKMDKEQKDYYLRQKIKSIHDRLGDTVSQDQEAEDYRKKLADSAIPEEYKKKLEKEINHLESMPPMMAETAVARNYLDWVFSLPWDKETKDSLELKKAQEVLDHDHYGLEKIKERILEYLAVRILAPEAKAPIICFVGPPGVGKTSLAQSIARAMNRKYCRISLGGIHDEAEIRGHRRTYIGAMPGRIISAITTAKSTNPVILLDEIDKLAGDYKGDPSSALLEVLDPEQNRTFKDNYLDIPFDLSEVLFITTANDASTIPGPLYDRMDVIELPSYTRTEKFNIAKRHLLPKQLKNNGLEGRVTLTGSALYAIIDGYTREAGVRNLERTITSVLRKCAQKIAAGEAEKISVSAAMVKELLGPEKVKPTFISRKDAVGIANGLAWTSVGGEMLPVEVAVIPNGTGKIEITGSLGDVMKESAQLAVTYAKVHAEEYGITPDKFKNIDLHIHAPEGAVPKDGPSAGVTLTTALISALSGIPVNHDLAMTGEITLHGNVLPIGGLKEKSMAAFREGISTVLIPRDNASDLYEVDAEVKEKVRFIPVGTLSEVLKHALVRPGRTPARAVRGVPQATSLIANDKPAEGHKEPAAVM